MPFLTPTVPDVDPAEFLRRPTQDRIRFLAGFWAENGFGTQRVVHVIYVVKLLLFYITGGILLTTLTSHVGAPWDVAAWWREPVIWQKLICWTVLLELLGVAGTWGPLAAHFKPMTGGYHYWGRPGTIRMPPWPGKVPLTAGDERRPVDVALYVATLTAFAVAIVLPGVPDSGLSRAVPGSTGGLVRPWLVALALALLVVLGLRDKVLFLAARGEQYGPALLFFSVLPFVDMIIAAKLLIVTVWVGAAVSKFGPHFENVIPPMVSNAPLTPKFIRKAHYRGVDSGDLKPSRLAWFMAHVFGTTAELVVPLVLLFSRNWALTLIAVGCMVAFRLFITSTFPLAVPLEWNIMFAYLVVFLFAGYRNDQGFGLFDFSQPWMLPVILVALVFFPVLGNLRPDLVSFLPSMRQYAGNWASATWAFLPGAEQKLYRVKIGSPLQIDQLKTAGLPPDLAEEILQLPLGWRSMHSQGRGLFSVLQTYLGDQYDDYSLREAEFCCNAMLGWNFGDGHLHDDQLIEAIQKRVGFAPGEFVVVWVESQPIHKRHQEYFVMDAALGIVERGRWQVADAVSQQPWLPDGPIPLTVTWRHPQHHSGAEPVATS